MKEVGAKFLKHSTLSLTTIGSELISSAEDLTPSPSFSPVLPKPEDSISHFSLNSSSVYIFSQRAAGLNLYKILNYIKPSVLCLQLRPDDVLPSNSSETLPAASLVPSVKLYLDLCASLREQGFLLSRSAAAVSGNQSLHRDRLTDVVSTLSAIWALQNGLASVTLADMPRTLLYRRLSRSLTLMQAQSILAHVSQVIGAQPDTLRPEEPQLPIIVAYKLYPHVFDIHSVRNINRVVVEASKKKNTVLVVAARETGQRVEKILGKEEKEEEKKGMHYQSIIQRESSEMVVEKIALFDVMFHGMGLVEFIAGHPALSRANGFIEEVVESERAESGFTMALKEVRERKEYLLMLYLSMLKRYSTWGAQKVADGEDKLKAEFIKGSIREF
jgi:hypothetical protein